MGSKKMLLVIAWLFLTGSIVVGAGFWKGTEPVPPVRNEGQKEQDKEKGQQKANNEAVKKATALILGKWTTRVDRLEITLEFLPDDKITMEGGDLFSQAIYRFINLSTLELVLAKGDDVPKVEWRIAAVTDKKLIIFMDVHNGLINSIASFPPSRRKMKN